LLARLALQAGDLEEAEQLVERALARAAQLQWAWWEANWHILLAEIALAGDEVDRAGEKARHALALAVELEDRIGALRALIWLARCALAAGDHARAGLLWGASENEGRRLPAWSEESSVHGGPLLEERRSAFLAASEQGRLLELWDAAAAALDDGAAQTVP